MKNKKAASNKTLNQTRRVVDMVKKSRGMKQPIGTLKGIKDRILKDIGFTVHPEDKTTKLIPVDYEAVKVFGEGKGTASINYKPTTIYDTLRSYRTAIKSLNIKHNTIGGKRCGIAKFKKECGERLEGKGLKKELLAMDSSSDMPVIRIAIKRLRNELRGDKQLLARMSQIKVESQAYYWIDACMSNVSVLVNKQSEVSFKNSQNNKIIINPDFILNWSTEVLNSDSQDWRHLTLALMAVTGRRTSEIIKTAIFTSTGSNDNLLFNGQLKQKDREILGCGAGSFLIPTLVNAEMAINGLKRLRKLMRKETIHFMTNNGVWVTEKLLNVKFRNDVRHTEGTSDKYAETLSSESKRLFNSNSMRPYLLRSAYTEIAFKNGMRHDGETPAAFRVRVLGHVNFASQGSYDRFGLSTDVVSIGYEKAAEKVSDESTSEILELLNSKTVMIHENTRAKGMHRLHAFAIGLAEKSEIELKQINAAWARSQIVDGKKIGAATVKQWLGILGLNE